MDDAEEDGTPDDIQLAAAEARQSCLAGKLRKLLSHLAARFERLTELFESETGKGLVGEESLPRVGDSFCMRSEVS
jgi:hypothetical protein